MCGRFTQIYTWRELHALYSIHDQPPGNLEPRYNIAPTEDIDVILPADGGHRLARARWGLVPSWWRKALNELPATFNARAETAAEKPMYRSAVRSRRCIVPASGFYEWTGPKGTRQPHYITAQDGLPLSLAGLWETWRDRASGQDLISATIIVCGANRWMSQLHHRMPVVIGADDVEAWLAEPRTDLLKPPPDDALRAWPVSPRVNSSRYQEPDAVAPVAASAGQDEGG